MVRTVADRLADLFFDAGLRIIFGLPGGENLALMDSFRRRGHRFVLAHHEASAVYMADAAARLNRQPSLCLATLGPGAANAIAGIAHAHLDRSPVILVTAQDTPKQGGVHSHQRLDLKLLFEPITKASLQVTPGNVDDSFHAALRICQSGRPGPVHLGLAGDVATQPVTTDRRVFAHTGTFIRDDASAERISQILSQCDRPAIVVGLGLEPESPYDTLRQLAERIGAPVITTPKAKGAIREDHPLAAGTIGLTYDDLAYQILDESDLILAIGLDVVELVRPWQHAASLIWLARWPNADPGIPAAAEWVGPLQPILKYLSDRAISSESDWSRTAMDQISAGNNIDIQKATEPGRVQPGLALDAIRQNTPADVIVVTDVGAHKIFAALHWPSYRPNSYLVSNGLSIMGYGLPAAIAAGMLRPERVVLALIGDGGLAMSSGELRLLAGLNSTVIITVFRDDSLELIRSKQERLKMPAYGTTFAGPDLRRIAAGYRLAHYQATTAAQCANATKAAANGGRPALIEVLVDVTGY
jgi:acetolactate synthase-1/2/3 large subunit